MTKRITLKCVLFFPLLVLSFVNVFGQLTISTALTPTQLIQNVLIQGGLSISGVTYTGASGTGTSQIGSFTNASTTYLGLTSGIVLSSGYVTDIPGAGNAAGNMSDATGTTGDADLAKVAGVAATDSYDASVLEFDFIPTANTVSFTYVFGSEEYPDYTCSKYDDAFGFFLSGPGITGPYSGNSTNIALIPGTALPVEVNSINKGSKGANGTAGGCVSLAYSSLYVNNTADPNIVFGGMTKVLTATSTVTPCQTYHIKIAVCDLGDEVYDSSVLLGANSFNAGGVNVSSNYSNTSVGNNAIKGCSNGIVLYTLPSPAATPYTINYIIGGTAVNGIDYTTIPNSVTIQTGQDTASVIIRPINNGASGTVILGSIASCDTTYDTIKIVPYVPMSPITSGTASICPGVSTAIGVTNSGGINPYTYNWSNGLGTGTSYNVTPAGTTTYTVTATDKCGQTASDDVVVTVANNLTVAVSPLSPTICPSDNVALTASGGATTYTWSPSTGLSTTTGSSVTANPTTTQLYTVTGSNSGCTGTGSGIVTVNSNLSPVITGITTICSGNPAILDAGGGYATYLWSDNSTLETLSVTTAGTYSVTVTSGAGCSGTTSITVNVNPNPTVSITASLNPICAGASTVLTASGGITYLWSGGLGTSNTVTVNPAGTTIYSVTGTDVNGCTNTASISINVNPNPIVNITASANPICIGASTTLTAGGATTYSWSGGVGTGSPLTVTPTTTTNYFVTGTDANGCTGTSNITVTVELPPTAQITPKQPTCGLNNGSATATGGANYVWSNGQTAATITGLAPNTYTVLVSSAAGCTSTASVTLANIPGPTITATSTNENCGQANGTASSTPFGGTAPLTYLWSDSKTTQNITGISAGTYTVTVTDGNTCTADASVTLTNIPGPSLQISGFVEETCSYGNGSVTVKPVNGVAPYSYAWSNSVSNTATASNLHAGTYTCIVTDSNHCTAINSITLTNTPGPALAIIAIDSASCGMPDGSSTLSVNGGTPPLTYSWDSNPAEYSQDLMNVPTGFYAVTVTDGNACTASMAVRIEQKPGPSATVASTNEICNKSNGTATVDATGGLGTYTYLWSNGQTAPIDTGLTQGTYSVTVSDGGCSVSQMITVNETLGPDAAFIAQPQVLTILDGPVTFIDNSTDNSTTIVNWLWMFGDNTTNGSGANTNHQYQNIGSYLVTLMITDNNGCMDTISDTIKVRDVFTLYIPNAFRPSGGIINTEFYPQGMNVDPNSFEMSIYDRWGNQIFHTTVWLTNHSEGWNGTKNNSGTLNDVVTDVYVYRIKLKEIDGTKHEYIGRITALP